MKRANYENGFYYVEIRSLAKYKTFRTIVNAHDRSGIERVIGQRADGTWDTVKWLIGKTLAHIENDTLVADHADVKKLFDRLISQPKHITGNHFAAHQLRRLPAKRSGDKKYLTRKSSDFSFNP